MMNSQPTGQGMMAGQAGQGINQPQGVQQPGQAPPGVGPNTLTPDQPQQPGMLPPEPERPSLLAMVESHNIAEHLEEEDLTKIADVCSQGFEYDLDSRKQWEERIDEWLGLALQVKEEKNSPWRGASNVKYPLLSTAAMQFNARAYPSLIPSTGDIVKCDIVGIDKDGQKLEQAKRISTFMSYQLLHCMRNDWEEDMDKLLIMLPIVGTVFKKTYYDTVVDKYVSELVPSICLSLTFQYFYPLFRRFYKR